MKLTGEREAVERENKREGSVCSLVTALVSFCCPRMTINNLPSAFQSVPPWVVSYLITLDLEEASMVPLKLYHK